MRVDLTAKPYNLSAEDIKWVEQTIAGMTEEEKIGQLFISFVYYNCCYINRKTCLVKNIN